MTLIHAIKVNNDFVSQFLTLFYSIARYYNAEQDNWVFGSYYWNSGPIVQLHNTGSFFMLENTYLFISNAAEEGVQVLQIGEGCNVEWKPYTAGKFIIIVHSPCPIQLESLL